jgi:glutaminyl-peptide cyclotransferase
MLTGYRSLANTMEKHIHPAMSVYRNDLSSISLFVLLDLLGSSGPNIPSYFPTTHWAYKGMATVESRLRELHQMKSSPNYGRTNRPNGRPRSEKLWLSEGRKGAMGGWMGGLVEDDHIPFMQKGVEILHIIPTPFPHVWHRPEDDGAHLDIATVQDWAQITSAFAAEYLELEGYMPTAGKMAELLLERSVDDLEENSWEEEFIERDEL